MGLKRQLMDRYERLVRSNAAQLDVIRERDQRVYDLEQELMVARAGGPEMDPLRKDLADVEAAKRAAAEDEVKDLKQALRDRDHTQVPLVEHRRVCAQRDEAMEKGIALAEERVKLRTLLGAETGQELEDRVRELMEPPSIEGAYVSLAAYQHLQGQEQRLREQHATLDKNYAQLVNEKEDALEGQKRAHDRAQALHVVIDHAVEELRKVHSDRSHDENRISAHEAIHILVNDDLVMTMDQPRSLLDQIRMKLDAATWGSIIPAIERLQDRAANWEQEALERTQNQTDLENRMDEAAKLLGNMGDASLYPEVRQAQALLVRGEGAEITQAEAWERTARGLNERINAAVKVLEDVREPSQPEMEALGLLTSDAAGDDPNIVDEGGE